VQRISITPRPALTQRLAERGMLYHEGYYTETSAYHFSSGEVDRLEAATNELFGMCLQVVQHVIDHQLWAQFFINPDDAALITRSWNEDDVSLYGRFDLGYDSRTTQIKLLEFNADTPTSLLEAAVIQYDWLQSAGKPDQWNSLHERLVAHLRTCKPYLPTGPDGVDLYLACGRDSAEDYMTVSYVAECAAQAGYTTRVLYVDEISVDSRQQNRFCTPEGMPIRNLFKLYPWEWLLNEEFAQHLAPNYGTTTWVEPPYKAILSNKMLLVYLWKLFPNHPLLLEAHYLSPDQAELEATYPTGKWCRKPVYSREGQNTSIYDGDRVEEAREGEYGEEGYILQRFFPIQTFDGWLPVLGAWVIGGEAAGMGIREQHNSLITDNMAQFAPHWFS
jgi:glutathionylspermidine synthase